MSSNKLYLVSIFLNLHIACFGQLNTEVSHLFLGPIESAFSVAHLSEVFDGRITDSIQIVGLGEVSHGTYEPMAFKVNMIKYLVEKKGYRKILLELSDFGSIRLMRRYLTDRNNRDTSYIQEWSKKNSFLAAPSASYKELFSWAKQFNLDHPHDSVVIVGFDLGVEKSIFNFILTSYVIPYSHQESLNLINQFEQPISDANKIGLIKLWYEKNKARLSTTLNDEEKYWLDLYIQNAIHGVDYLVKSSEADAMNPMKGIHFRDSILAKNVVHLSASDKAIIWAHNGHLIRGEVKFMGDYLNNYYRQKYYVIATDFSKYAVADVVITSPENRDEKKITTKIFKSDQRTAASIMLRDFGISKGIFFSDDLLDKTIPDYTNVIDAGGIQLITSGTHALDALVVFDYIYSQKK